MMLQIIDRYLFIIRIVTYVALDMSIILYITAVHLKCI
jgi:hypothetical protein